MFILKYITKLSQLFTCVLCQNCYIYVNKNACKIENKQYKQKYDKKQVNAFTRHASWNQWLSVSCATKQNQACSHNVERMGNDFALPLGSYSINIRVRPWPGRNDALGNLFYLLIVLCWIPKYFDDPHVKF